MSSKKPFFHGFRGKSERRLNLVILFGVFLAFLYLRTGEADWSAAIAKNVSLSWKWLAFLAFWLVGAYTSVRMRRRISTRATLRMHPGWLFLEVLLAFLFAVVAAHKATLFYWGTLLWVFTMCGVQLISRQLNPSGKQVVQ